MYLKYMKKLILIVFVLFQASVSFANEYTATLDSAEVYYQNQQYYKAIKAYQSIVDEQVESVALFYNLGNAYYKDKNIPMAIAYYEKALKLNPNDQDVIFNLNIAKTHTIDKIERIPTFFLTQWFKNMTTWFSSNTWAYISILGFALCLILILLFLYNQNYIWRKTLFYLGVFSLLISITSAISASYQKKVQYEDLYAIISNPSVNIKSSPDDNSTNLFILHSGTKLLIIDQLQDWFKIKIENGNIGWIKKEDVIKV